MQACSKVATCNVPVSSLVQLCFVSEEFYALPAYLRCWLLHTATPPPEHLMLRALAWLLLLLFQGS